MSLMQHTFFVNEAKLSWLVFDLMWTTVSTRTMFVVLAYRICENIRLGVVKTLISDTLHFKHTHNVFAW